MRQLFAGGDTSLEAARKALEYMLENDSVDGPRGEPIFYSADEVALRAPIAPRKIFHAAGVQNVDAIVGHEEPVIYPEHLTQELDCEIELAVVLKKGGKHFAPEDAMPYIGGYVIFNGITARDIQRREKPGSPGLSRGIDTFCPLGPWIVTADEIPDPQNLAMELRVNGEPRQSSSTSKMLGNIPEILSQYSPMGYSAGNVVCNGTTSGIAAFSGDPKGRYLKVGDVIEGEIEGIGILRNRIISWEEAYGHKPAALATQETSS
jgi:2-keto-4-pentenoate hydratase/2-oxohepta-3-ene-1,7-dioic acid hydratase in catechol pathway